MSIYQLVLYFLLFPYLLGAQVRMPANGDLFYFQIDKSPDKKALPAKGNVKFWDYSYLQSPYVITYRSMLPTRDRTHFVPAKTNITLKSSGDLINFYNSSNGTFGLTGFSGEDPFGIGYKANVEYTNVFRENLATLKMGKLTTEVAETYIEFSIDNVKDVFLKKLPLLPDSIRLNVLITRKNKVDGTGKLFLPDITLLNCTRITREESYDYTIDTKTGNYKWIDATELFAQNINELPASKTDVLFFNSKYLLPVLKLSLDGMQNNVVRAEYLIPPKVATVKDKPSGSPDITLYPNPAFTKEIKVEFSNIPQGRYTFKLYSLIGKLEKSVPYYINNSKFDTIDISELKPGIYIYALVDSSGKILQSKRLTIISP